MCYIPNLISKCVTYVVYSHQGGWDKVSKSRDRRAHFTPSLVKNVILAINNEVILHSRSRLGYNEGAAVPAGMESTHCKPI